MSEEQWAPAASALDVLSAGPISILGQLKWASNGTFLARAGRGRQSVLCVYKPLSLERPLWDFPPGLFRREVAAYVLSEVMELHLVPPTVLREDAPLGPGSLQLFVRASPQSNYFELIQEEKNRETLALLCLFDLVSNNADRKAGHCIRDTAGRIWGIDHGLCFHVQPKLRTVIWDFAGEPLPTRAKVAISSLLENQEAFYNQTANLLTGDEIAATIQRATAVAKMRRFPHPRGPRPHPWPLV